MKRINHFIFLCFLSLVFTTTAFARPPSKIDLNYDAKEKNLHMELAHISENPQKHHIRSLFIYQNDLEIKKLKYNTQTSPSQLIEDVSLDAKSGDVIRVLAICNKAGRKEETLVIP